jgi:hypothetical protein
VKISVIAFEKRYISYIQSHPWPIPLIVPKKKILDRDNITRSLWQKMTDMLQNMEQHSYKPRILFSGNLSGMGKSTFGDYIFDLLTNVCKDLPLPPLFSLCENSIVLSNSIHLYIDCNHGVEGDNFNNQFDQYPAPN